MIIIWCRVVSESTGKLPGLVCLYPVLGVILFTEQSPWLMFHVHCILGSIVVPDAVVFAQVGNWRRLCVEASSCLCTLTP